MLESLKRFFASPRLGPEWRDVAEWAKAQGLGFKRAHGDEGFVVEGAIDGKPWRLEWGPPQRTYVEGRELRLRMEAQLPPALQMLLLSRPLMSQLEKQTYDQFVEGTQTQIDTSTPEEMRWLVMYQKADLSRWRALKAHLGGVGAEPEAVLAWLDGPLAQQLESTQASLLQGDPPFVLMTLRGRAYLRTQLIDPEPRAIGEAVRLFETAVRQAWVVAAGRPPAHGEADWPSSEASTAWQNFGPTEPPREL